MLSALFSNSDLAIGQLTELLSDRGRCGLRPGKPTPLSFFETTFFEITFFEITL